jgi:hypothetical protein
MGCCFHISVNYLNASIKNGNPNGLWFQKLDDGRYKIIHSGSLWVWQQLFAPGRIVNRNQLEFFITEYEGDAYIVDRFNEMPASGKKLASG